MATKNFGVKIFINDHMSILAQDTDVGLYNISDPVNNDAAAGQKEVEVVDPSKFEAYQIVCIGDDNASEENTVDHINGSILVMANNLANTYQIADAAYVHANSHFSWTQNDITGVLDWNYSMLAAHGLGETTQSINLKYGGSVEDQSTGEIRIKNTSQFNIYVDTNNITLNGAVIRIYEFANSTPTQIYTGICEEPEWDSLIYKIGVKGHYNKRISALSTKTADDITLPLSFGKFLTTWDASGNVLANNFARAVRTSKAENFFNLTDIAAYNPVPASNAMFKVSSGSGRDYVIKIADSFDAILLADIAALIENKYVL